MDSNMTASLLISTSLATVTAMENPSMKSQYVSRHKQTCSLCARRKVKCDKSDPCSNCLKAKAQCIYEAPAPYRPRKRVADEELLSRIASYEELMRKHDINFALPANTLKPSKIELTEPNSEIRVSQVPAAHDSSLQSYSSDDTVTRCLWSSLSSELKHPPIQSLRHKEDPFLHPTPSLQEIFLASKPKLQDLHPDSRHIYRLWQIFVESVNPLTKIVHVPTLQQQVLEATWDIKNVSQPLTAILFAMYTLAITSLSSEECQASFGESRGTLLTRYRTATIRALIASDFLTSNNFEVLQAFVLFLFANPDSELTSTLTGAAIRLGQKMGLHRESPDSKTPFFEKEMRIRLWWQLHGLESRNRFTGKSGPMVRPSQSEFGEIRLPLNINDADLHPDMTEPPVEHNGPTDMICLLMKFELFNWLRTSLTVSKVFDGISLGAEQGQISIALQDEAISELEMIYQDKYLSKADKRMPLYGMTHDMAGLMIARMRFKAHHPRGRVCLGDGERYLTHGENDILFDSALKSLELVSACMNSIFSSHHFIHMTSSRRFQMDTFIYVISELRRRCSGDQVQLAWKLVEDLYEGHPELIQDDSNTFSIALCDLTLDAWGARRLQLVRSEDVQGIYVTPRFIQKLQDKRQKGDDQIAYIPTAIPDSLSLDDLGLTYENNLDWGNWNNFLTF